MTASNGVGTPALRTSRRSIGKRPRSPVPPATVAAPGNSWRSRQVRRLHCWRRRTLWWRDVVDSGNAPDVGQDARREATAITIRDQQRQDAGHNFTLTVNQAPAITALVRRSRQHRGQLPVTATGAPTPSVTQTGALPGGLTFVDNGNGTATLSGTPSAGTAGSYPLTITATNGIGTPATQSVTLTVNQAPAITSGASATFTAGSVGSFTITATGTPTPVVTKTERCQPALRSSTTKRDRDAERNAGGGDRRATR
jgi:hypothetical protein